MLRACPPLGKRANLFKSVELIPLTLPPDVTAVAPPPGKEKGSPQNKQLKQRVFPQSPPSKQIFTVVTIQRHRVLERFLLKKTLTTTDSKRLYIKHTLQSLVHGGPAEFPPSARSTGRREEATNSNSLGLTDGSSATTWWHFPPRGADPPFHAKPLLPGVRKTPPGDPRAQDPNTHRHLPSLPVLPHSGEKKNPINFSFLRYLLKTGWKTPISLPSQSQGERGPPRSIALAPQDSPPPPPAPGGDPALRPLSPIAVIPPDTQPSPLGGGVGDTAPQTSSRPPLHTLANAPPPQPGSTLAPGAQCCPPHRGPNPTPSP